MQNGAKAQKAAKEWNNVKQGSDRQTLTNSVMKIEILIKIGTKRIMET